MNSPFAICNLLSDSFTCSDPKSPAELFELTSSEEDHRATVQRAEARRTS